MLNPSHDLLLLLLNLTQLKSSERVLEVFMDAVGALFESVHLRWLEPEDEFVGKTIPVATINKQFGWIAIEETEEPESKDTLPLLRNGASMLAVILEKCEIDRLLSDEKLLLKAQVKKRTSELSKANVKLQEEIADRKKLQEELVQARKMEALGRLAGGVAHDFNNLLTGITGYTEMAQTSLNTDDPMYANLDEVRKAADRAAELITQLLAFSRKQIIAPKVIQPNDVLSNSQRMLQRIIGEDIDFVFKPTRNLWRIKADPGQLDQVLVNLAVNARDAMQNGGKLIIETQNVSIDDEYSKIHVKMESGVYVKLTVADSGHGMDEDTLEHIFEPFYSTKAKEHGTGLGLSTVYGIMRQNNGFINVYSKLETGTTFEMYFPAVMEEAESITQKSGTTRPIGTETVLLVEDEEIVRELAKTILTEHGYKVIDMDSSGYAFLWADNNDDVVDLLLTDVVMPGMNGKDLHEKLKEKRPELKALFMSGYTEDIIAHHGVLEQGTYFIQKPFTIESVTRKVREALDS
ncbi:MAG: response regulator [Deltaproteobacteria bacterium]|nr:response regulator [Deltaproteobacteria bacterium]